jgi:hypothetical protein
MELEDSLPSSKCPPTIPILSQMNLIQKRKPCFLNVHFNIILPSTSRFSKCLFHSGYLVEILYAFFIFAMLVSCSSSHPLLYDRSSNMWWRLYIMKLLIAPFLQPSVTSPVLCSHILLFWNTLNLYYSLDIKDHVSHPHKTTGILTNLYRKYFTEKANSNLLLICSRSEMNRKRLLRYDSLLDKLSFLPRLWLVVFIAVFHCTSAACTLTSVFWGPRWWNG